MFLENKYRYYYYSIIEKAKSRKILTGYTEQHHIIPKSLGGSNNEENLVTLSAREHFVCHWLLTKMCIEGPHIRDMHYAFKLMCRHGKTPRLQEIARRTGAKRSKESIEKQRKTQLEQYANGRKGIAGMKGKNLSEEAKAKISATHKGKKKSAAHREKTGKAHAGKTWRVVDGKRVWFER